MTRGSRRFAPPPGDKPALCVRDAALEAGSDAHYTDPTYYAATYAERSVDVDYYVGLVTALSPRRQRVLEYGAGNGRITLPLARAGASVTAVDRSVPMLADLRRRVRDEALTERIAVRRADMRTLRMRERFPMVLCPFNTVLHLYTRQDAERFFARVRAHLTRRGTFVVDMSVPEPEELARTSERAYRVPRFMHPTIKRTVRYAERFDYDPMAQVLTVGMEFEPVGDKGNSWVTPLAHRQFFPQEMEALLHYNGFKVFDIHADFVHQPPHAEAEALIYHCRLR